MTEATITATVSIPLDVKTAAKWFASISDDDMCQFFVAVAEEAKSWPVSSAMMWCYVGKHLAECECSTEDARQMLRDIVEHMEHYCMEKKQCQM